MEPGSDKAPAATRRINPTVLAAVALAAIVLLIVALIAFRGGNGAEDRLGDNQLAGAQDDPEKRCAGQATYDLIKRELFRRAAQLRGSDQAAFDRLSAYSAVRMEAPILRDENAQIRSVTCSGTFTLDLPPGVAVVGGRRTLSAELLYTIQPAADGSGNVITLSEVDDIVTPLATLARVGSPVGEQLAPTADANATAEEPGVTPDTGAARPQSPQVPQPPEPSRAPPQASAGPSFNCGNARTRGEIAVCRNSGLAALDRTMAAQFASAMSRADPGQRRLLSRTRDSFLSYRDRCPSNSCIAETYRGRMREISDIMAGRWQPQR
jgi:hypothetical protein